MALQTLVGINLTRLLPAIFKTRRSLAVSALSTACETEPSTSSVYYLLAHKHRLSHDVASVGRQKKYDSVLAFFVQMGFTKAQLERTLNLRPHVLAADLEGTIKPKIKIFEDLGFSSEEIAAVVSKAPVILHVSLINKIIPALSWLKGMLGSNKKVAKVLRHNGRLLLTDFEKLILPNIRILLSHGMTKDEVSRLIYYNPWVILYNQETLIRCLDTKDKMGISWSSKMSVYAVGVICSMPNGSWERKRLAFQEILEFSNDEIMRTLQRDPNVFCVSEDKMRKVKSIMLRTEKYDNSSIAEYPRALMFSIERRLKPRFEVLGKLESKGLIEEWPSLGYVCRLADKEFSEEYVEPYMSEIGLENFRAVASWQVLAGRGSTRVVAEWPAWRGRALARIGAGHDTLNIAEQGARRGRSSRTLEVAEYLAWSWVLVQQEHSRGHGKSHARGRRNLQACGREHSIAKERPNSCKLVNGADTFLGGVSLWQRLVER
ncbi:Unknown protein [Striga hermonthica]|uniref:Mitochondrial transcription termination factor family protein n=1 Tax=Striga hermonthica TaxID=68872 RepID=A0A9N7R1S6_STRHE|nr:Unknown protein [Striga hermonthica]